MNLAYLIAVCTAIFAPAYGLWTTNGDGTNQCLFYGGYAWQPSSVIDARIIPGTEKFVCIYTTVHNLPLGAMVVVDRQRGLDGTEPILKSWPADIGPYMAHWDKVDRVGNGPKKGTGTVGRPKTRARPDRDGASPHFRTPPL